MPCRRALRSHTAQSTAERARPATPGRPALRTWRRIADQAAATSSGSTVRTTGASISRTTSAAAAGPYVHPRPVTPPSLACTTTRVVCDQASVPSASGASVGTR